MENKNFSVWNLENHQTKDITDSHMLGPVRKFLGDSITTLNFRILINISSKKLVFFPIIVIK